MPRSTQTLCHESEARCPGARRACSLLLAALMTPMTLACGSTLACTSGSAAGESPKTALATRGPQIQFEYVTTDGRPLSTQTLMGRLSVIGFVTTYDIASQAQVRFLSSLLKRHKPRINVAVLVLETAQNRPMVEAFVSALALPFPAALADPATIAGEGPFTGLHHVPSVVILDRQGREAWRHIGIVNDRLIEEAVREVEQSDGIGAEAPAPR